MAGASHERQKAKDEIQKPRKHPKEGTRWDERTPIVGGGEEKTRKGEEWGAY